LFSPFGRRRIRREIVDPSQLRSRNEGEEETGRGGGGVVAFGWSPNSLPPPWVKGLGMGNYSSWVKG